MDTYAFKCEAKQSSLEVALTASRGAACAFIRGGRGFEAFFFFFIRVLSLSTWFAVLPVPRVICWTCVNLFYFRQHSDAIRIQFLEGARGTLQEMMRSNHENRIPENTSSSSFPQNIYGFGFTVPVQASEPLPAQRDTEHVLFSLGSDERWLSLIKLVLSRGIDAVGRGRLCCFSAGLAAIFVPRVSFIFIGSYITIQRGKAHRFVFLKRGAYLEVGFGDVR